MPRNSDRTNVKFGFNYEPRDPNNRSIQSRAFPDSRPCEYLYNRDPVIDEDQLRTDLEVFEEYMEPWMAREFYEAP